MKKNDPVLVSNDNVSWSKRHFSHAGDDGKFYAFNSGGTEWTANGTYPWTYCVKPQEAVNP